MSIKYFFGKILSFFGVGVLYMLVCLPRPDRPQDFAKCKCGITGWYIGAEGRAKQVSDALPGLWFTAFFCIIPFVYQVEQILHWLMQPINAPFKSGSGKTEVFWFPAHIIVAAYIAGFWVFEIQFLEWIFGVNYFWPFVFAIIQNFHN